MKKLLFILCSTWLALNNFGTIAYAVSDEASQALDYKPDWSYHGATAPEYWGSLQDKYVLCEAGTEQSPIDLRGAQPTTLEPLIFDYHDAPLHLVNIGYTLEQYFTDSDQLQDVPYSYLTFLGNKYQLKELHFHAPSEHTINGESYPMAMHLVHADANGNLAVIGVLMQPGISNESLTKIFTNIPEETQQPQIDSDILIDPLSFIPHNKMYYHYRGSLTTPPCDENVNWIVMVEPIDVSPQQIQMYQDKVIEYSARPVQELKQRKLLVSTD